MNPSEFLDAIERLLNRLKRAEDAVPIQDAERTYVRSVIGAWFEQYRPSFLSMIGDENLLFPLDELLQALLKTVPRTSSRRTVMRMLRRAEKYFTDSLLIPISRAYWSRASQRTPPGRDEEVAIRLAGLDANVAESYEQLTLDLQDETRLTYRGPAGELREILTVVLHKLAPTESVQETEWYKEARRLGRRKELTPTRAERVKFILRGRIRASTVDETAEQFAESVEERLANLVNTTYRQGSAATHMGTERTELGQLLQYINALLRELLPTPS